MCHRPSEGHSLRPWSRQFVRVRPKNGRAHALTPPLGREENPALTDPNYRREALSERTTRIPESHCPAFATSVKEGLYYFLIPAIMQFYETIHRYSWSA